MTTLAQAPTKASTPPPTTKGGGRLARWLASWKVSLRMARRDARLYKGRSVLITIMVALPVALIVAGLTWGTSASLSVKDQLPTLLGTGQGYVNHVSGQVVQQGVDGSNGWWMGDNPPKAKAIPGFDPEQPITDVAAATAALSTVVPGKLIPVSSTEFRWTEGKRRPYGAILAIDPKADLGSKLTLLSGRWPTTSDEVVVTPLGLHDGLPRSGEVPITSGGERHTVTVVGVADAYGSYGMPHLMTTQFWPGTTVYDTGWIVKRDTPITWSEVRQLNQYGIAITSAEVVRNPPPTSEMPNGSSDYDASHKTEVRIMGAILGATLFLVTALLVGPAFAVSAGRQRRTLALAASNGAETRQLRRSVLAQALILGVLAVAVGVAIGILVVAAAITFWRHQRPWTTAFGPVHVPVLAIAIVAACAVLAALTAALLPALRLGRLDIVGVMKGQNVSPRHSRVLPVIGVVVFALGGAALFLAVTQESAVAGLAGVFGLIIGALMLIPLLLVLAGRVAARFPVAVRMATRDAARQRHRSVPTVAALMAGTALLATFAVALASDTAFQKKTYLPQNLMGEGSTWVSTDDRADFLQAVKQYAPSWVLVDAQSVGLPDTGPNGATPANEPIVTLVRPGCTAAESVPDYSTNSDPSQNKCASAGTRGGAIRGAMFIAPADEIIRRLGLSGSAAQTFRATGLLVSDPAWLSNGSATIAIGEAPLDESASQPGAPTFTREVPLHAGLISEDAYRDGAIDPSAGLVLSTEQATALKLPLRTDRILFHDPAGPISADTAKRVSESLPYDGQLTVERGFQRDDRLIMAGVFGIAAFLLITVTLISTALALAEQQADMATLAAVGATKGTRRRFAAAQAATVAVVGSVLGLAIGVVAGIAIAYPATTHAWDNAAQREVTLPPTISIPYLPVLAVVFGVPLVAALIAAFSIRKAPAVTRRAT